MNHRASEDAARRSRASAVGSFGDGLGEVYLAAENGIIFDSQAEGANIAFNRAAGAQFHASAGCHIALHLAENEHILGGQIGFNVCAGTDGQPAVNQA